MREMSAISPSASTVVPGPAPRDGITALLVDDQGHARTYLRMILRSLGVTTTWEASNGEEAVELYSRHRPVVVFLDHNMPLMSGRDTIVRMLELDPDAAVVIMTGDNSASTVKYFAEHGAIAYVLKSNPREAVRAEVAEILDAFVVELA